MMVNQPDTDPCNPRTESAMLIKEKVVQTSVSADALIYGRERAR
jgi:hypothetical protein